LKFEAEADGMTADKLLDEIMSAVEAGDRDPIRV